jgi:prepilin-type N-terminal cleavage/methylation domain-containing protein
MTASPNVPSVSPHLPRLGARRGYTLVEALVVVAIIGIVARMALPRIGLERYEANAGVRAVVSSLAYAQRQAISQQADIRVAFDVANRRLRVHEDRNNDNVIDAAERVTFTSLPQGITFDRGTAPARPFGPGPIQVTRIQAGLPVLTFHRDGSASEAGGLYITSIAALAAGRNTAVRAVEFARATGRATWFSYGTGAWKRGD